MELKLAPDLPPVRGDRVLLEQVLLNLVLNSLQAMQRHAARSAACVQIEAAREGDDAGGARRRPRPGHQPGGRGAAVRAASSPARPTGLGLGLNICRTIIESHGGHLGHENRAGGGARLLLHSAACTMNAPQPEHLHRRRRRGRAPLAGDAAALARPCRAGLRVGRGLPGQGRRGAPARLRGAGPAHGAASAACEVFDQLLARRSPLVVLFLSGHGDIPLALEQVKKGACDWITKPSTPQVLAKLGPAMELAAQRARDHRHWEQLTPREKEVVPLLAPGPVEQGDRARAGARVRFPRGRRLPGARSSRSCRWPMRPSCTAGWRATAGWCRASTER